MRDFRQKEKKWADENAIAETTALTCMYLSWEKEHMSEETRFPKKFLGLFIATVFRKHNYEYTQVHIDAVKTLLKDPINPNDILIMRQNEKFDGHEFRRRLNFHKKVWNREL